MGIRRPVWPRISGVKTDATGFEHLVDAYYRPLFRFALSLTNNQGDASDMTQHAFYMWATRGYQLRDGKKAKTWLFTTLYREFLHARRQQYRFPHYTLDDVSDELPSIAPGTDERLDASTVLHALGRLPESYQTPLVLFYLGEHSYKEIAEILAIPIGTVQSRIARAKKHLQQMVSGGASEVVGASPAVDTK